jgi:hypothetical protein
MKKNAIYFYAILLAIVLIATADFFIYNQKSNEESYNISNVSDQQIISILSQNSDAVEYIKNHPDFRIQNKTILTKDAIIAGQNGVNFREVYQELDLQDNRYMRVDLTNVAGNKGLITVIDFKTKGVSKVYGILLLKAGIN